MTDTVTISREEAASLVERRAGSLQTGDPRWALLLAIAEELRTLPTAPSPPSGLSALNQHLAGTGPAGALGLTMPSGLREALEKIKFIAEGEGEVCLTWGTEDRAAFSRKQIIELCIAALASPDDGWVKVDEEHPVPSDLKIGDEIDVSHEVGKFPIEGFWGTNSSGQMVYLANGESWRKSIKAYRRHSAEQGG